MNNKSIEFVNNKYEIIPLSWDTEYFGVKSAKVILKSEISSTEWKLIQASLCNYEFITIVNQNNLSRNNYIIANSKIFLSDINIQLEKEVNKSEVEKYASNDNISITSNLSKSIDLERIAKHSFSFSRFFNDPNLNIEKARDIYKTWVGNSFEKENKFFAIYNYEDLHVGFILFSNTSDAKGIIIELIAIDSNYYSKGIGKELIKATESHVIKNRYQFINVGTQVNNFAALNFYAKCGFKVKQCNAIYHFWNIQDNKK